MQTQNKKTAKEKKIEKRQKWYFICNEFWKPLLVIGIVLAILDIAMQIVMNGEISLFTARQFSFLVITMMGSLLILVDDAELEKKRIKLQKEISELKEVIEAQNSNVDMMDFIADEKRRFNVKNKFSRRLVKSKNMLAKKEAYLYMIGGQ